MSLQWLRERLITGLICVFAVLAIVIEIRNSSWTGSRFNTDPRLWLLELRTGEQPMEMLVARLTTPLEEEFLKNSELHDITTATFPNKVAIAFWTSPQTEPSVVQEKIKGIFSSVRSQPQAITFQAIYVYKALGSISSEATGTSDLHLQLDPRTTFQHDLVRLFKQNETSSNGSFVELIKDDLTIHARTEELRDALRHPQELSDLLRRLQAIPGIQLAIGRNINLPVVRVKSNPSYLLQLGILPKHFTEAIAKQISSQLTSPVRILERQASAAKAAPASEEDVQRISIPSRSNLEYRLADLAEIKKTSYVLPFVSGDLSLFSLEDAINAGGYEGAQSDPGIGIILESHINRVSVENEIAKVIPEFAHDNKNDFRTSEEITWAWMSRVLLMGLVIGEVLWSLGSRAKGLRQAISLQLALWVFACALLNRTPCYFDFCFVICCIICFIMSSVLLRITTTQSSNRSERIAATIFFIALALTPFLGTAAIGWTGGSSTQAILSSLTIAMNALGLLAFNGHVGAQHDRPVNHPRHGLLLLFSCLGISFGTFATVARDVFYNAPNFHIVVMHFEAGSDVQNQRSLANSVMEFAESERLLGASAAPLQKQVRRIFPIHNEIPSELSPSDILPSFRRQIPGWLSVSGQTEKSKLLPLMISTDIQECKDSLESTLRFLQSPPLNRMVTLSQEQEVQRIIRQRQSEVVLSELYSNEPRPTLSERLSLFLDTQRQQQNKNMRVELSSAASQLYRSFWKKEILTLLTGALVFLWGSLFFSSTQRGALTSITFFVLYGTASAAELVAGSNFLVSFPTSSHWLALLLLGVWAIMLRSADLGRRANLSLRDAFRPCLASCDHIRKKGFVCVCGVVLIGLAFPTTRQGGAVLALGWLLASFFLPRWMLFWVKVSEERNRLVLKMQIRLVASLMICVAGTAVLCPGRSYAAGSNWASDTRCDKQAIVVLPIVGRPKGNEPPPQRAIFSERLVQETPCAWINPSLTEPILQLMRELRGSAQQEKLIAALGVLVEKNRKSLQEQTIEKFSNAEITPDNVVVIGGYYEEFFGNIAFTVIYFPTGTRPVLTKITVPEAMETQGIATLAKYTYGNNTGLLEAFLGESERLPVFVEPVESLDKHPVSENLARELDLFLRSRLTSPLSFDVLERKSFFRAEADANAARYRLNVKIRRDGTRFYSSITTVATASNNRRTAWIESDISQLPAFEEDVLAVSQKTLSSLEGIADYCVTMGADYLIKLDQMTPLYGIFFRQNLGNAALSLRVRTGNHEGPSSEKSTFSLLGVGGAAGWQFADLRWLVADTGLSGDVGLASATGRTKDLQSRVVWLTYGPYIQSQLIYKKNFSLMARAGLEQPQTLGGSLIRKNLFADLYANLQIGLGVAF